MYYLINWKTRRVLFMNDNLEMVERWMVENFIIDHNIIIAKDINS